MIRLAIDCTRAVGLEITIFNAALDTLGSIAEALVNCLARSLDGGESHSPQHL